MKQAHLRKALLPIGLVIALASSAWVYYQDSQLAEDTVAAPVERNANARPASNGEDASNGEIRLALDRLQNRDPAGTDIDPFRAKSWFVAPPPPPPAPPPKPTAPPLPFQYMGMYEDSGGGGKPVVYLARGNDSFAISPGDKFDASYQLEKIDQGKLVILYLPLSVKQTLPIGD